MKSMFLFTLATICGILLSAPLKADVTAGPFKHIYDPSVGESGSWYINDHCFIYGADKQWHLFGITHADPLDPIDEDNFAHAAADSLTQIPWRKQPFALSVRADLGEHHLWAPYVICHEGLYYMYYCAGGKSNAEYEIRLATSTDLYNWQRHPENPMLIDGYDARDPYILKVDDTWIMYYTATDEPREGHHTVTSVRSRDLIHWTDKKIVFTDPEVGKWGGPTESPTVVRRGKYYYLFIGPRDGYRGTCVYRSETPYLWTIDNLCGRINSHAAEVVRDGDGKWYVSHCGWGQGGVYLAELNWNDGIDDNDTSIPVPSIMKIERQVEYRRIAMKDYRDKMYGGWLGQMVAVAWGFPVEFKYKGQIIPEEDVPVWKPEMINDAFGQDDLYVEMTFLQSIQRYGFDVSYEQAGIDFGNTQYPLWHANDAGRSNIRKGISPPDSGHPQFNSHADDIDYQIEADFSGLITPGMPNFAVELGNKFGRIMNYGDGLYGGHFVGAMYSLAFFETDVNKIVRQALDYIPAGSMYAEAIRDTIALHQKYPDNWRDAWNELNEKYQKNPKYRQTSCDKGDFNIDAKINGAFIVMGILYGQGDIEKTIKVSMRCGQDADCNPSNAAGILFTSLGHNRLPHKYRAAHMSTRFSNTDYDMYLLLDVCETLARRAVYRQGGFTEHDEMGNEIFVIPFEQPQPNQLESMLNPGPIANTTYTDWQMKQIKVEQK